MSEFDFGQEIPMFYTVGMLREILKNYSDDTTLYVGQSPGLVFFDEEQRWIELQSIDSDWGEITEFDYNAGDVDYMDF